MGTKLAVINTGESIANAFFNENLTIKSIAKILNRSPSTINENLRRFCKKTNNEVYKKLSTMMGEPYHYSKPRVCPSVEDYYFYVIEPSLKYLKEQKAEFIESTEDLIKKYESANGWQPLETAPHDGTWFLIKCDDGKVTLARFSHGNLQFIGEQAHNAFLIIQAHYECRVASKWQPLPS